MGKFLGFLIQLVAVMVTWFCLSTMSSTLDAAGTGQFYSWVVLMISAVPGLALWYIGGTPGRRERRYARIRANLHAAELQNERRAALRRTDDDVFAKAAAHPDRLAHPQKAVRDAFYDVDEDRIRR